VKEDKQEKVINNNDAMFEIDLSNVNETMLLDMAKFKNYVINEAPRHWIHNPHGEFLYQQSYEELIKRVTQINATLLEKQEALKKKKERQNEVRLKTALQNAEFERKKAEERQKYEDKLNELESYHSFEWRNQRELLQGSELIHFPVVEKIQHAEKNYNLPKLIDIPVRNDWIFNIHRSVWQAEILTNMVFNNKKYQEINANAVKRIIVLKYDILPVVKELNNLKQEYKKIGRERDKWYQDVGCWFFSDEENRLIPSPFQAIIEYLNYLSNDIKIIEPIGNYNFSVLFFNSKEYINFYEEKKRRYLIATQEWEAKQKIRLEKKEARKREKIAKQEKLKDNRIREIIASERRVFELFNREGHICRHCYLMSHMSDGNSCLFCGATAFKTKFINLYDIENAYYIYRCCIIPELSIKSNAAIDNKLLIKWLNELPSSY
jgi:hypothetical protein